MKKSGWDTVVNNEISKPIDISVQAIASASPEAKPYLEILEDETASIKDLNFPIDFPVASVNGIFNIKIYKKELNIYCGQALNGGNSVLSFKDQTLPIIASMLAIKLGKIDESAYEIVNEAVAQGVKVEMEHSDTIERIIEDVKNGEEKPVVEYAQDIAEDHVVTEQNPEYYDKLPMVENKDVPAPEKSTEGEAKKIQISVCPKGHIDITIEKSKENAMKEWLSFQNELKKSDIQEQNMQYMKRTQTKDGKWQYWYQDPAGKIVEQPNAPLGHPEYDTSSQVAQMSEKMDRIEAMLLQIGGQGQDVAPYKEGIDAPNQIQPNAQAGAPKPIAQEPASAPIPVPPVQDKNDVGQKPGDVQKDPSGQQAPVPAETSKLAVQQPADGQAPVAAPVPGQVPVAPVPGQDPAAAAAPMAEDQQMEAKIEQFLKENKEPSDASFHAMAEKLGMDPSKVEEIVYKMLAAKLGAGKEEGKVAPVEGKDEIKKESPVEEKKEPMEEKKESPVAEKKEAPAEEKKEAAPEAKPAEEKKEFPPKKEEVKKSRLQRLWSVFAIDMPEKLETQMDIHKAWNGCRILQYRIQKQGKSEMEALSTILATVKEKYGETYKSIVGHKPEKSCYIQEVKVEDAKQMDDLKRQDAADRFAIKTYDENDKVSKSLNVIEKKTDLADKIKKARPSEEAKFDQKKQYDPEAIKKADKLQKSVKKEIDWSDKGYVQYDEEQLKKSLNRPKTDREKEAEEIIKKNWKK